MVQSRERLPTLFEVLNRMSAPPVDLWTFYEFMRTHYRGVEYLDFWLDAANHVKLCKLYVEGQELGRATAAKKSPTTQRQPLTSHLSDGNGSGSGSGQNIDTSHSSIGRNSFHSMPSPSSSMLLDMLGEQSGSSQHQHRMSLGANSLESQGSSRRRDTIARLSALLDEFQRRDGTFESLPTQEEEHFVQPPSARAVHYESDDEDEEADIGVSRTPVLGAPYERVPGGSPTQGSPMQSSSALGPINLNNNSFGGPLKEPDLKPSTEFEKARMPPQAVTLEDIYASVNSIVQRYLTPGADREVLLPGQMARQIRDAAQGAGRRDPALFNEARDYVFEVMEREAYPTFLASAALRNVQPASNLFRLLFGMIALFGAFWLSFVFILLDWKPKLTRLWIILPFSIGWYLVISSLYSLDFILGLLGYSEQEEFGIAHVKEAYVAKLIRSRSVLVAGLTVLVTACCVVLFALVPGHRL